ncbi:LysM domain-containing protein [Sphingosinicella sp. LHD-64]|uniref:LysM peptidoglycan-binding domain-containing protein n=1 Tax=Sphingosinicella sp. LHD-64 TaxID=3072139 RepID=UPI00280E4C7C|nr:LysM domain-containing protein [Sphingosinicella sp. LHD-64]MDQ8755311.1 LysM domain-containing protein [Sphingosinicella sp. LHD-64]
MGIVAASAVLTACSSAAPAPRPGAVAQPEEGGWRGREGVQEAIALLNRGDVTVARERLMSVLRRDAGDGIARQLLSQIDGDPRQMLGAQSYSYTLRDGETLSTIAQRVLGNPMMFYILARYNDIAVPESVRPGQVIRIPGRRSAPAPERRRQRPAAPPRSEPERSVPPPAAASPRPSANPALAARLRAQGLAALNGGAVDRAVALLRRAAAADPGNAAIRGDLERALRVQRTVRSRR